MCIDLQPAAAFDVPVPKSYRILTQWNHSCSGPANYHMVLGPCIQTLTDIAALV